MELDKVMQERLLSNCTVGSLFWVERAASRQEIHQKELSK
jgi:hypothetical protein